MSTPAITATSNTRQTLYLSPLGGGTYDQMQAVPDPFFGAEYEVVDPVSGSSSGYLYGGSLLGWVASSGAAAIPTDLSGVLASISALQQQQVDLSAQVGQNTSLITALINTVTTQAAQIATLNSKVLPSGASAPAFSAAPTITGTLGVNSTLTFVTGTYSGTVTGSTYTLRRGSTIIQGPSATTTYPTVAADGSQTLTLTQTLASAFPDVSSTSIGYVISTAPAVPVNTVLPSISGTAAQGQTATLVRGTYTNTPTSYTQQWYQSGARLIVGETATTHVYSAADVAQGVYVIEIAVNATGQSLPATSSATIVSGGVAPSYDLTNPASIPPGYLYQAAYQVGTPMLGDVGAPINNPDPTLYTYQHYRGNTPISGATSLNYTPVTADGSKILQLGVIPRNANGAGAEERSAGVYVAP